MGTEHAESPTSRDFQGLILAEHPTTVDENTETPEEFEVDDEDELGHPEDDDAD